MHRGKNNQEECTNSSCAINTGGPFPIGPHSPVEETVYASCRSRRVCPRAIVAACNVYLCLEVRPSYSIFLSLHVEPDQKLVGPLVYLTPSLASPFSNLIARDTSVKAASWL